MDVWKCTDRCRLRGSRRPLFLIRIFTLDKRTDAMRPYATRSFAEVRFVAYLLHALGLLPKLREALLRGDTCLKSDAAIALEDLLCIFEFDPGYTHPPERG